MLETPLETLETPLETLETLVDVLETPVDTKRFEQNHRRLDIPSPQNLPGPRVLPECLPSAFSVRYPKYFPVSKSQPRSCTVANHRKI